MVGRIAVFLFALVLFPTLAGAERFTLYGNIGEPLMCENVRMKIFLSDTLPAPAEPDSFFSLPEVPEGRMIHHGSCPAGPLTFEAEPEKVLVVLLENTGVLHPVVKGDRVVATGTLTTPKITVCSSERGCAPLLPEMDLDSPFYRDFLLVSVRLSSLSRLRTWRVFGSGENSPEIDDSFILQASTPDFLFHMRAIDGKPGAVPPSLVLPEGAEISLLAISILGKGHMHVFRLCHYGNCADIQDRRIPLDENGFVFTVTKLPLIGDPYRPAGHFREDDAHGLLATIEERLLNVFISGDEHFFLHYDGWMDTPAPVNIEPGVYVLGDVPPELRFLAAGRHTIEVFDREGVFLKHSFEIADNRGLRPSDFSPEELNDPDPASIGREEILSSLVSPDFENFIVKNIVPGEKIGEFHLPVTADERDSGIEDRWCEVYEPELFGWLDTEMRGFFYFNYLSKEIVEVTGAVVLKCYEKVKKEEEDEEGNTRTEVTIEPVSPPQEIEVSFVLESENENIRFSTERTYTSAESAVTVWFSGRLHVTEPVYYRAHVRLIVRERDVTFLEFEGKRSMLSPSPVVVIGERSRNGFTIERVLTDSGFAALRVNLSACAQGEMPRDLRLLLVFERENAEDVFHEVRPSGKCWRKSVLLHRNSDDPESVSLRILAVDDRGVLYPGPVTNRLHRFTLPDPFAPAGLVLSVPDTVRLGDHFEMEVGVVVFDPSFLDGALEMGFYEPGRGWVWVDRIVDGAPEASFDRRLLAEHLFSSKSFRVEVPLPERSFTSFTILGAHLLHVRLLDGTSGEEVESVSSVIRILP